MKYSLKELRARKEETQEQTAAAVGVSPTTYCSWEKSLANVAISKVASLCEHFQVKLDDIKY